MVERGLEFQSGDLQRLTSELSRNGQIEYGFPYTPENFTEEEKKVLLQYFSNVDRPVFAVFGLPQEVVGALFSRYSRSPKSARRLFLDEFWTSEELNLGGSNKVEISPEQDLDKARSRATKFYDRVLAEYGDDSVLQMGSVHIAFEFVSQIAAKAIEDQRIGAAYIEKSTRYLDFGGQENGHYLFMEPDEIIKSPFKQEFINWNNEQFEAYKKHLPTTIEFFKKKYPISSQKFTNSAGEEVEFDQIVGEKDIRKALSAYERALKGAAFDVVRVFLPTTTVTNLGAHFSGQAAEHTINKLLSSPHRETKLLGLMAYHELSKVSPSFLKNIDHRYGENQREYLNESRELQLSRAEGATHALNLALFDGSNRSDDVALVDYDPDADVRIAAQLVFKNLSPLERYTKSEILNFLKSWRDSEIRQMGGSVSVEKIISDSVAGREQRGRNRRQKLPRAFEHASAEVEFYTDFGIFRDLQRNRMMSLERQSLRAEEVFVPEEFKEKGMESVLADYQRLAQKTRDLNRKVRTVSSGQPDDASEYVTLFGNKLRYSVRANLRQWGFFTELRTIEGGQKYYRWAVQKAAKLLIEKYPFLRDLYSNINWTHDYGLGRLRAEVRTQEKLANLDQ